MSATRNKFSPEFRDRAVRMVEEHRGDYPSEWAAMSSIAAKVDTRNNRDFGGAMIRLVLDEVSGAV